MKTIDVDQTGYVYFIEAVGTPYVKIGCSADPETRLKQIGLLLPYELKLMCSLPAPLMYREERRWHERYAHRRTRGEWFLLTLDDRLNILQECILADTGEWVAELRRQGFTQAEINERWEELKAQLEAVFFEGHQEWQASLAGNDWVI